ncbi:MAG: hypothetical protein H7301_03160 [Cryobacterium sp.]|nr:hypothetical protein [Oligoflexia bacterium]
MFKLGYRMPLQHSNCFSLGFKYAPQFAEKIGGISVSGTYKTGPYVSFQRYFAGNHLMLNFWLNPFYYENTKTIGSNGVVGNYRDRHYF